MQSRARSSYAEPQPSLAVTSSMQQQRYDIFALPPNFAPRFGAIFSTNSGDFASRNIEASKPMAGKCVPSSHRPIVPLRWWWGAAVQPLVIIKYIYYNIYIIIKVNSHYFHFGRCLMGRWDDGTLGRLRYTAEPTLLCNFLAFFLAGCIKICIFAVAITE